ncbi:MAG: hypothetical protein P8M34_10260 [Saprospiraceae bacterium]|nr:hypothetical protein [Saprospiraceae bacterium]
MKLIILFFSVLFIYSCSSDENSAICVSFDTKQCMGDPWSDEVDEKADASIQSDQMKSYLMSRSIDVIEVKVVTAFHQVVCEACFVCPIGPRFFIEANESEISKIEALELLNYSTADCSEF